jgi:aminopeptidase
VPPVAENVPFTPEELERYTDAVVRTCLAFESGDALIIQGQLEHRDFVVAIAEAAWKAGAREVDAFYGDPRLQRARLRHAPEEYLGPIPPWHTKRLRFQLEPTTAMAVVIGETEPGVFSGIDPKRIALDNTRPAAKLRWYQRAHLAAQTRWVIAGWPTAAWAKQVYPELDEDEGRRRLGQDLLWFCRLGSDDPADGWARHAATLAARADAVTELGLERLELRAPGTELDVGLACDSRFVGGRRANGHGRVVTANFPTEEVFTTPMAGVAEGTFRCTKPLSLHGRVIEGIAGEFRRGRLVRLDAAVDEDRDYLETYLDSDKGGRRLGEVALVDRSSRIGRSDRTYSNTLLDENAVAHMAFGAGFGFARADARPRGVNRSSLHLDVMIGSDELDVIGVRGRERVPLLAGGTWQL